MPKRKSKRKTNNKKLEQESSSNPQSDAASVVSDISDQPWTNEGSSIEEIFKDLLDQIGEKRASLRIGGLKKLRALLQTKYIPQDVDENAMTMCSGIANCIRGRDSKEAISACIVLGLAAVTLGTESHSLFSEFRKLLTDLGNDHTKKAALRAAAIRTLSMLCFVGCDDQITALEIQKTFQSLFSSKEPEVASASTNAWSLLASTLPSKQLASQVLPTVGPKLYGLLESKHFQTKENAGRGLALLCEAYYTEEDSLDKKSVKEAEPLIDEVTEMLQDLATASVKSQNKKERARQRASFREFLHTLEGSSYPSETLIINGTNIKIAGWVKCMELAEMRWWLGVGLQTHLKENELLSQIFEYELQILSRDEIREAREDRIYFSKINRRVMQEKNTRTRKIKTQALVRNDEDD
mmetsp:Transcript_1121/g.1920  ORF Transcript_1121/g.1920 Transcript_1121/m.1920 type:complete len:410 (-) Transcript_1121:224-1453(-)|eukprot:CAMPEP_0197526782 /NCGR_PEP_ID=MMETSP1318-20131121/19324_1 /TAXON_ID=552666 /ORGANISM="Partenskyella glossopodia, Strain RCC365" /LENGTH=409 /DNA_ID=CAMNT_0043081113 /DNA_START=88 /DNA_END=1317 /DNA_ORIENTATION=+